MDFNNLTKKQKIIVGIVLLVALVGYLLWTFVIGGKVSNDSKIPSKSKNENIESVELADYKYFEITGQVLSPGVYESDKDLMVIELIQLAGGLSENADLYKVHKDISLSTLVEDRQKIYIPGVFELSASTGSSSSIPISGKVNINTASSQELESLPDIGPATAQKIISNRPFSKLEDIKNVQGIGDKTYNNIVSLISI